MTNETLEAKTPETTQPVPFGNRLTSAREAMGLERKDAAAQLRLNENIILMMEKERYPSDLPATFIRGYLRAYAKLLQIPDHEIRKAVEPIKQKISPTDPPIIKPTVAVTSVSSAPTEGSVMQFFSYLIFFALLGAAGYWYTHNLNMNAAYNQINATSAPNADSQPLNVTPEEKPAAIAPPPIPAEKTSKVTDDTSTKTNQSLQEETTFNKPKAAAQSEGDSQAVENDANNNADMDSDDATE